MKKRHALFLLLALLCLQAAHAERSFLVDADWLAAHIDDNGLCQPNSEMSSFLPFRSVRFCVSFTGWLAYLNSD